MTARVSDLSMEDIMCDHNLMEQIDSVMAVFRGTLKEYALDFVVLPIVNDVDYDKALENYMRVIYDSDAYNMWRKHLKEIIDDCEDLFGMERWWARSSMNFNLDDEVKKGYKAAWDQMSKQLKIN